VERKSIELGHKPRLWAPRQDLREIFLAAPDPIDGLRGLSILMVILFHCFYVLKVALPPLAFVEFISSSPTWLRIAFSFDKAVDIFFVLSGYLIGQALIDERKRTGRVRFFSFYQKRLFRIAPLFWIALLFYGSFAWKGDLHSLVANFFFFENLVPSATKLIPVGWSLAVEVQFYLLAPLIVTLFGSSLLRGLMGLLVAAIVVRWLLLMWQPGFYEVAPLAYLTGAVKSTLLLDTIYYPTWARFGPLVLGLMTPVIIERYADCFRSFGWVLATAAVAFFAVGLVLPTYSAEEVSTPRLNMIFLVLDRMLIGVAIVLLIAFWKVDAHRSHLSLRGFFSNRALVVWGRLVYPTYLFHLPFIGVAFLIVFQTLRPASIQAASTIHVFGGFFISLALMMPVVLALHVLVERPFIRLGKRVP
jgi:peptidoglycan/LPS O-acetylase OafA/YrhL